MSAIKIYSNASLLIVMWDHRPPGRFAPHDEICDILRAAIKSRISANMLSLRIWYSVIIHITYSLLHKCNFFQMLMQINRSNWGHLQKGALCPMLLYQCPEHLYRAVDIIPFSRFHIWTNPGARARQNLLGDDGLAPCISLLACSSFNVLY